jgi:membrane peptidoglycan carboxypeptidase
MGFTPSLVAGVWAGNNDNSPMRAGADGIVVAAPIWRSFMNQVLSNYSVEQFPKYEKEDAGKAVLNGDFNTQELKVCKIEKGKNKGDYCLANDTCPSGAKDKVTFGDVHDILFYVNKDDPRGDAPKDPNADPQYKNWEKGVQNWLKDNKGNKDLKSIKKLDPAPTQDCKDSFFPSNNNDNSSNSNNNSTPDPTPTCSDGTQNGDETGKDCGGSCPACV